MPEPFVGEIRLFPYNNVPSGWQPCSGQSLPVAQNAALFSLISTVYGGNGNPNFQLPDLRGRVIVSQGLSASGRNYVVGQTGGSETVQLDSTTLPMHTHSFNGTSLDGAKNSPNDAVIAKTSSSVVLAPPTSPLQSLNSASISSQGSGSGHENRQPSLALIYCIATQGIYPSRP